MIWALPAPPEEHSAPVKSFYVFQMVPCSHVSDALYMPFTSHLS